MKNTLSYEKILGFKSMEIIDIGIKMPESVDVLSVFNDLGLDTNTLDLSRNIEIEYKTKGKPKPQKLIIPKGGNYSGASLKLPASTVKATLRTTIKKGSYNNTWLILQNRNIYIPKLEINSKKLLPNNLLSGVEDNEVKITTTFNTQGNNNTIVGIWFN
jgi:hypothetical protein